MRSAPTETPNFHVHLADVDHSCACSDGHYCAPCRCQGLIGSNANAIYYARTESLEGHCAALVTFRTLFRVSSGTTDVTFVSVTAFARISVTGLPEGQFLQVFSVLRSAAEARSAKYEAVECYIASSRVLAFYVSACCARSSRFVATALDCCPYRLPVWSPFRQLTPLRLPFRQRVIERSSVSVR